MIDMYKQRTYASRVGVYLKNFKQKKAELWEFSHSCETQHGLKALKRRAYIYKTPDGKQLNVKCQHCGYSKSLAGFIRETSVSLYDEYRLDAYRDQPERIETKPIEEPKPEIDVNLVGLTCVKDLPMSSSVRGFLERRKIPTPVYKYLYVTKDFFGWAKRYNDSFKNITVKEPRLILPYFTPSGEVLGFTCRAFSPKAERRYIHLRVNKKDEFIYGLQTLKTDRTIYVLEGNIDSLFVANSVAVGGANYNCKFVSDHWNECVIIPDNDWKRNPQVGKQLYAAITRGIRVCFMPDTLKGKDINDYVKNGLSIAELQTVIEEHTYAGLNAVLQFAIHKKYKG